jgi:hypothetical protein
METAPERSRAVSQQHAKETIEAPPRRHELGEGPGSGRQDRYRQAATLLHQWMAEDDGYDQETWPLVKEELKDLRTRCRE